MRGNERMNDLPRLLKPYYSIEETFKRLNLAGANLDKEDDVLLLARNGMLKVSLLCDRAITLIRTESAQPTGQRFDAIKDWLMESTKDMLILGVFSQKKTDELLQNIENSHAMLTVKKGCFGEFVITDCPFNPKLQTIITPVVSSLNYYDEPLLDSNFVDIKPPKNVLTDWQQISALPKVDVDLSIVELDGQTYYVCHDTLIQIFEAAVSSYTLKTTGSTELDEAIEMLELTHLLNSNLVSELIEGGNFVVLKTSIQNFEREYLGVNHELDTIEKPPYLDKGSDLYARELDIAIKAHTAIFVNNEGNTSDSKTGRVTAWLKNNYPEDCGKSASFIKRITTVVLPKN